MRTIRLPRSLTASLTASHTAAFTAAFSAALVIGSIGLADPASAQETPPGREGTDGGAAQQRFDELQNEFGEAQREYFRPYMEAKTDADREKIILDPAQDPVPLFVPRFVEFAKKHEGSASAVEAWMWVVKSAARSPRSIEHGRHAAKTLVDLYRDHPALASPLRFAYYSGPNEFVRELHQELWEKSETDTIRAAAGYGLAQLLRAESPVETPVEPPAETPAEPKESEDPVGATGETLARTIFLEVKENYGALSFHGDLTYEEKITGDLFELDHLAVGKVAPEIVGEDIDGESMKLSDYRGKVILLDFWGDW